MYSYDLYTGEPTMGSPPSDSPGLSEQEIVNNANLMYNTNPQQRVMQQNQMMYNTGIGYNQSGFGGYMNQPQQPVYGAGFQGYAGNPAYGAIQQNQYYNNYNQSLMGYGGNPYQPQFRDYTYVVPGFNTGSTGLLPSNAEEICDELQMKMMKEQEEAYVKRMQKQQSYYNSLGYNNGVNYYGMPYANQQYADITITNKYRRMIDDMRQQAMDNRLDLNKRLSRLCHNYLGDDVSDNEIDDIYSSKVITIPGAQMQENYEMEALHNAVEIDPSIPYKEHDARVSATYRKYFDDDTDLKTFFENIGQVMRDERLEEEEHRRRDLSQLGDTSAYKHFMRRKIMERNNIQLNNGNSGFTIPDISKPQAGENIPMGRQFPTLNEAATMLDDNTISITAPPWLNSKTVVIQNEKENEYDANERKFIQAIYGNNPVPGGGVPNGNG